MSYILGPFEFMIPRPGQLLWNLYIKNEWEFFSLALVFYSRTVLWHCDCAQTERWSKVMNFKHVIPLFVPSSSSLSVPRCRAHSDHVHPPHGRGRPAERQGGYHLSGSPLLLRFPHLPQELFWRGLLPHSGAKNEAWHSKGGNIENGTLCVCICYALNGIRNR